MMKRFTIAFISLLCLAQYTYGNPTENHSGADSVSFIQIGNLTYKDERLFLTLQISHLKDEGDLEPITKEYQLPQEEAVHFRELVRELDLFSIRPNNNLMIDVAPFSMKYTIDGVHDTIVAYRKGMSPEESRKWSNYINRVDEVVDFRYWEAVFYDELPDGMYSRSMGMIRRQYVKEEGEWFDMSQHPLYILDGIIISPLKAQRLLIGEDNYEMEVIKGPAATAIYGARGANGVIVLKTKKK